MFAARARARRRRDPAGARARRLGAVRPLHRRDLRLPGRRPRRRRSTRIRALERWVHADCQPDLTLLFDVPPTCRASGSTARGAQGRALDKFEREAAAISSSACATSISRARRPSRARFRVIDSTRPLDDGARASCARSSTRCESAMADRRDDDAARRDRLAAAAAMAARDAARDAARARATLAARAAAHRRRAASASARWRSTRAGAAVRDAARRRLRVRHVRRLPLRRRRPASGPARASSRSTSTTTATSSAVDQIPVDTVRALIDWAHLTSHRGGAKVAVIAPAERMNAAAANALLKTLEEPPPGTYLHAGVASARALAGDDRQPLPARRGAAARRATAALAWLAAQGVAMPGARAGAGRRRAARGARARRPGCQAERAAWLAALAEPRRRCRRPRSRRASTRRAQGRARHGWRDVIDWLIAWTADLARVAAGGAARAQRRIRRGAGARSRRAVAPDSAVSLSSVAAAASARCSRIRCSRASSPRRC